MKVRQAQLIHKEEKTLYFKDGEVIEAPATETERLAHAIFGETKVMATETIIERWNIKSQKEATAKFWNWMEENKKDSTNYYIVFTE